MNALQGISQKIESLGNRVRMAAFSIQDFRKTTAILAYRKHTDDGTPANNRIDPGILNAITRWLSAGDVCIEFYLAGPSGEVRVKVIDEGGVRTRDLSLNSFVGNSLIT